MNDSGSAARSFFLASSALHRRRPGLAASSVAVRLTCTLPSATKPDVKAECPFLLTEKAELLHSRRFLSNPCSTQGRLERASFGDLAVRGLIVCYRNWLLVLPAAAVLGGGALLFLNLRDCCRVAVAPPQFKLVRDEATGRNAGWKLVQSHDDFDAHFVLHVPRGARTSIVPEFDVRITEQWLSGPRTSSVNVYLPLLWDGESLDLESETGKPAVSHFLVSRSTRGPLLSPFACAIIRRALRRTLSRSGRSWSSWR
jgi:hypothetical protein